MSRPEPARSQSTTSLSRFYNSSAAPGGARPVGEEDLTDPRLDFCNSFWGVDGRGYDVVMARLRGAGRTIDELKAFWKERSVRFQSGPMFEGERDAGEGSLKRREDSPAGRSGSNEI